PGARSPDARRPHAACLRPALARPGGPAQDARRSAGDPAARGNISQGVSYDTGGQADRADLLTVLQAEEANVAVRPVKGACGQGPAAVIKDREQDALVRGGIATAEDPQLSSFRQPV